MLTLPPFFFLLTYLSFTSHQRFSFLAVIFLQYPFRTSWTQRYKAMQPPCTKATSYFKNTSIPSTVSQIDAKMFKFTKHLVSDMKNTRIWSSCFHLQKQSWRKTGGLSFNCCCWLAKWRGESKRQLTATLTARTKSIHSLWTQQLARFFGFFFLSFFSLLMVLM